VIALSLVGVAGCVGPLVPGGAVAVNGRVRYLAAEGGTLLEIDCPDPSAAGPTTGCVARRIEFVPPPARTLTGPEGDAVRAASGCPVDQVTVQSGDADSGYWLWACGHQRFYRRIDGAWVDATPAAR